MRAIRLGGFSVVIGILSFLALMYGYEWCARPLKPAEVDAYMAAISAQRHVPGGRHDLPSLRRFLETDDGKPVHTVNLYTYRETADYPRGVAFGGSGREAYERFSQMMIRQLALRGSHPIYGSTWMKPDTSSWDRLVIVRYRSRRDMADLFASEAFADGVMHNWASLEANDRMLAQAIQLPNGGHIIVLLSLLIATLSYIIGSLVRPRANREAL